MLNDSLRQYIEKQRSTGISDEQINQDLLKAGWKQEDLKDVFVSKADHLQSVESSNFSKTTNRRFPKVIIVFLLLMLVFSGAVFVFFFKGDFSRFYKNKNTVVTVSPTPLSSTPISSSENLNSTIVFLKQIDQKLNKVIFYDLATNQPLSPFPELTFNDNAFIQLGKWSTDGKYLPIFVNYGPKDLPRDTLVLYLFNSSSQSLTKLLFFGPQDERREYYWTTYPLNTTSQWFDTTKLAYAEDISEKGKLIKYVDLSGNLKEEIRPNLFQQKNAFFSYSYGIEELKHLVLGEPTIATINLGNSTYNINLEKDSTIISILHGKLVTLVKPRPITPLNLFAPTEEETKKLTEEQKKLEAEGLSELEITNRLLNPKGETTINLIDLQSQEISQKISLTEYPWNTMTIQIHPSESFLIAHQTEGAPLPGNKERLLKINLQDPSQKSTLSSRTLVTTPNLATYDIGLQGVSFFITADGNSIITYEENFDGSAIIESIVSREISTGKLTKICDDECGSLRVYNPLQLLLTY